MFRKFVGLLPALMILGLIAVIVYFMLYKNKIPDAPVAIVEPEVVSKEEVKAPPTTGTTTETSGKGAGGTAVPKA